METSESPEKKKGFRSEQDADEDNDMDDKDGFSDLDDFVVDDHENHYARERMMEKRRLAGPPVVQKPGILSNWVHLDSTSSVRLSEAPTHVSAKLYPISK